MNLKQKKNLIVNSILKKENFQEEDKIVKLNSVEVKLINKIMQLNNFQIKKDF